MQQLRVCFVFSTIIPLLNERPLFARVDDTILLVTLKSPAGLEVCFLFLGLGVKGGITLLLQTPQSTLHHQQQVLAGNKNGHF